MIEGKYILVAITSHLISCDKSQFALRFIEKDGDSI
jgi:hypothetical protein